MLKGFNEFGKKLSELQQKSKSITGKNSLTYEELFSERFMNSHTNFNSIQDMFDKSPFNIDSIEDFEKVPDKEWDKYIAEVTKFDSWEEMHQYGVQEWIANKLGL